MYFFFFKQKTAYEMRISDWSSDVCSSDLDARQPVGGRLGQRAQRIAVKIDQAVAQMKAGAEMRERIGRVEARHIGGKQRFGHGKSLNIARTGLTSAPTLRSGRATSSYRPSGTSSRTSPSDRTSTRLNSSN